MGIVTRMMAALFCVIAVFCQPGTATLGSGTQDMNSYLPPLALLPPAMLPEIL